jgi:uncharacterized membrane protein
MVMIMVANHYPTITYGHDQSWLMLGVLLLVGAGIRWVMNFRMGGHHSPGR